MKITNRLGRSIAATGIALALVGGLGLPAQVRGADEQKKDKDACHCDHMKGGQASNTRNEMHAMREKMLEQAKQQDAEIQRMVAELRTAPEGRKAELQTAIITRLADQHHQMVTQWENLHARMQQLHQNHGQMSRGTSPGSSSQKPGE